MKTIQYVFLVLALIVSIIAENPACIIFVGFLQVFDYQNTIIKELRNVSTRRHN